MTVMAERPVALRLSQAKLFEMVGFVPHIGQREILQCDARFQTVAAGRRFGKSAVGGNRLLTEAFKAYYRKQELKERGIRAEFWIVGPNYTDSEKEFRVLWNRLTQLDVPFDKPGTYNDPIGGNMHISLWGGAFQVHGKSAAHPESLVGEGLHGAIIAEAAKIRERVWVKYVRPTLNDFHGWALLTSTPEGKNWFYEAWQRGEDPMQTAWKSFRMPAWVNPHVYPHLTIESGIARLREALDKRQVVLDAATCENFFVDPEIGQLIADLSEPTFNQEIAALFTEYAGRVFQTFDEEVHVTDLTFDPSWLTVAAVDYGFTNPNVWLLIQVDPFGQQINVLDEVYESGLSPDEFAAEILRRGLAPAGLKTFYPDPASPGDTRVLESKLKVKATGGTGGELKFRLESIRQALRPLHPHLPIEHPESRPRIMFDRRCVRTIKDMNDYRYPEKKADYDKNSPELPMKKDDHAPEALGRFFVGHFGKPVAMRGRARTSQATMRG